MAFLRFKTSNISSFSNGQPAYLIGKNGFTTELGVIPALVTSVQKTDSDANVAFTVRGLNNLWDPNSSTHILNNNTFTGTKQLTYKVLLNESETDRGDVAFVDPYVSISSNIEQFYTSNNVIIIKNQTNEGSDLYSKLEVPPFYIKLFQPLLTDAYSDKSMFVSGTTINTVKYFNVFTQSGSYSANIGLSPIDKKFISVFLDGEEQSPSLFTWDGQANVSISLANSYSNLKIISSVYTFPTIEMGDNVSIVFNNTYSIANTSYISNTSKYNSTLVSNSFFKIYTSEDLKINATSFLGVNISPNPVGAIGNVSSNNSFTLDYNSNLYPGNFHLANNFVYRLVKGNKYTPLNLIDGRTLYDVPPGTVSVRAQNINPAGRKSPYATSTVEVAGLTLPAVTNLSIVESLYYDTTQGVASRATVSFSHAAGKEILAYELSYKIEGETSDLESFNTVQIPSSPVDVNGRLRYTINNVDRGRTSGVNYLVVRVTPINNDLTGITKQVIHTIIGKSEPPDNVSNFTYAQNGNILTLFWEFVLNSDNTLKDLDLQEVEIRKVAGITIDYENAWNTARYISTVAIPSTNHNFIVDAYGTFTYLIKTRDTSRNESTTVRGFTATIARPTNLAAYKTWSEDEPSANASPYFIANENYAETNWTSFETSDNGGFNYAVDDPVTPGFGPSTLTENANGTSSGFTVGANTTDLFASGNAFYQTSVRDIGLVVTGKISLDINVYSILATTWFSLRENIVFGVSDATSSANVLWDDGSYIGSLLQSNNAVFQLDNQTLVSPDTYGNVYAIWNAGQHSGDYSNSNSFSLIAGVVNTNAIALGATYYANGNPTFSNNMPNLTTNSGSYQLVNLKQWGDAEGLGNWYGPDSVVSYNAEIRYSTNNVAYPVNNTNVNVISFTSSNTGNFLEYTSSDIEFRWFQLRVNIINQNPSLAVAVFDKFNYNIDLQNKTYSTVVTIPTNPTFVDYSLQGFKTTPVISLVPIVDSPLRVGNTFTSYSSINSNTTQANITVYSNTGIFVPNVNVNFTAIGF